MINTLKNWIITNVQGLGSLDNRVYGYVPEFETDTNDYEYPNAYVIFTGSTAEYISIGHTERTYSFTVRLQYELGSGNQTKEAVDTALYDLADAVIDKFDKLRDVGGTGLILDATTGVADFLDSVNQIRYVDVEFSIRVIRDAV